ncbi:type III secretion system cytoplasmic ring protein SctQ [Bordetella genomosp. 13]|uniref:type III secretion system cytoplasmic ring protein SctQ n=1 Tax=Bordetella genomosp. 13 TaxID=463040 RepID=UPI0021B59034|nr:type III secretion system cytoplasmic ring protein SctQ [Bordetella genomosp. 13]
MLPVTAHPASLPRLSANEARALTLIARHGADFAVDLLPAEGAAADAAPASWRVGFTAGAVDALRQAADWRTGIEWAGATLRLALPRNAPDAWLAARLPGLAPGPLPEALRAAALETLLEEVVAALTRVSPGGPAHVQALEASDAARLPHVWTLTLRAVATGEVRHAVLEADGLGLMLLASLIAKAAPAGNGVDTDALPVTLRATLGAATLPAAELRSLRPRDVVLLDEYLVGPQGELWLGIPQGQGLRVRAEHSTYIVTEGWTSLMTQTPESPAPAAAHVAEPLDVDAIPVRLTFDLGERSLTLADLRRLQPGETFDLQRPLADGPVMIRANGALLGTGTLVEIDGRIGVTIATLGKESA